MTYRQVGGGGGGGGGGGDGGKERVTCMLCVTIKSTNLIPSRMITAVTIRVQILSPHAW